MNLFEVKRPRLILVAAAAAVVFVNALAVVYSAARNRAQFAELSALREQHEALLVDYGRLELEEWTLAAHARVAKIAANQFDMQPPEDVRIVEVK
jgi:cell division protein FtsL